MNRATLPCSDERLQLLLYGDEQTSQFESAQQHLESCPSCQSRFDELAADQEEWSEARRLLTVDEADRQLADEEKSRSWSAAGHRSPPRAWTESMASQLLSPPSHPEMLGRIGRYEVERLFGAGGMGVVFKAFDSELNRPVAVKVLAPHLAGSGASRNRFAREARAAAAVVDEHVVAIHNVETDGESPFLVMQYVAGESLQARLDRCGPLSVCEILRIGMQTASGLAAAHAQGLIHRDVKPSNVLLEESIDRALLTDFGLARAVDDASMTRTGVVAGTPQYMSPEQVRGEAVDQRSDLFSLGSVLYAMCTGRAPFRAETSYGVLRRITDDEPRPIREINPDIPEWLCRIIERLMAKQPDERFESAAEVAELLEACLAHVQQPTVVPLPEYCVSPAPKGGGRRSSLIKLLLGSAFALAMFFAGVLIVLEWNKGTLKIECDADDVPVRIKRDNEIVQRLTVTRSGASVRIAAGEYVVEVDGAVDGIVIRDGTVQLHRGGKQIVRIVEEKGGRNADTPSRAPPTVAASTLGDDSRLQGVWQVFRNTTEAAVNIVTGSPDGKRLAVANGNPTRILQTNGASRLKGDWKPTVEIMALYSVKKISLDLATDDEDDVIAGTVRVSHIEATALAFSPDGNMLAVGTSIGQVKFFDARTGEFVRALNDEESKLTDGETPESWKPLQRAMGNVRSLAFSPDGRLLAVCGASFRDYSDVFDGVRRLGEKATGPGRLQVWEVETGTLKHDLVGHSHVSAVAFSPDGKLLASAGHWMSKRDGGTGVILWNPETGEKTRTFETGANGGTHAVAFSPDSKRLIIGSRQFNREDDTSATSVRMVFPASGIEDWRRNIAGWGNPKSFTPDGAQVAVQCGAKSIQFLDTQTGATTLEIEASDSVGKGGRWRDFAILSGDTMATVGGNEQGQGIVDIWKLAAPDQRGKPKENRRAASEQD